MESIAMLLALIIAILVDSSLLIMVVYTWTIVSITLSVKEVMDMRKEDKEQPVMVIYKEKPVEEIE